MKPNTTQHNNMNNFLSHHHNILLLLLLLLFLLSFSSSSSSHQLTLRQQASILVSLKHSFKLSNSSSSSFDSWNLSNTSSVCFWPGIQCDDTKKSVVSLNISNSNISTTLSPLITLIPTLVNLSVSDNNFSGAFPFSNIHHLPNLRLLNISNNLFSGELDWDFSRLQNLVVLDAYNNNFNGSLPYGVTFLPNLAYLNFAGNYFSGSIPRSYGNMGKLKFLSLAGNDLSGSIPSELGNLTSLEQLYLGYYNEFEGGIPGELGKLNNLFHMDLSSCGLEGPIPPELGNLKKLDTLFLQINQLSGSVPSQLGNLSSLRSLDLSNNGLTGEISVELVSGLSELTLVNLFMNKFHGEIPNAIAELPKLAVLKLWQNNFTGAIPTELGQNGELTEVDLSTNKLTGTVPKSMCFGRKLKILILLNNFLFGPLPNDLGQCETLVRVRMGQNYLTGTLPNGFLYLPNLSLLELQNNYLSGQLEQQQKTPNKVPSSKLSLLNLSNNRLSGQIPTSLIGNFLSSLQIVLLTGNQFSGEIPSEIGHLKKTLFKLDISRNKLRGKIPPTIANCVLLTYLDLSQNQLTGPIPPELSQIHILNYLNLSWNNLIQGLPKELGTLKSLTSADFSHNNLSGPIPETGQYLFFNSTSFIGNPNLFSNNNNHSLSPSDQQHPDPNSNNQNDAVLRSHSNVPSKFKLMFALGLLLCSFVFATFAIVKTRKSRRGKEGHSWKLTAFQKVEFRSSDILECVKDNNVIGRGGAGVVYRGNLPSGEQVAVKKLLGSANKLAGSSHHDNGLAAEIQTLGKIRHRNIVRLLAFCSNRETNLLVYEFMENGSLGEVLHGKGGGYLKWETRLKIAIEAAKGLSYLHHDCSPLILHRDVKSNNILLNSEYEAHVADFGLAKFLRADNGTSECMSAIAGSYGYIAPEYAYTLKVDEKSDVYSFGVVLLELLTGRRPVGDFGEEGVVDIVQWAKTKTSDHRHDHHRRRRHQDLTNSITSSSTSSQDEGVVVVKMLDQRLSRDETPLEEAMQVFFVAMLCVQEQSVERPTMREVVQMLAQAKQTSFHF